MIPTWWRHLVKLANRNGKSHRRAGQRKLPAKKPVRPAVEQFEERLVPTTVRLPAFSLNPLTQPSGQSGTGFRGGSVLVPITVDILDDSSNGALGEQIGLSGGEFVVYYDTKVFAQLTASNVTLGVLSDPIYNSSNWK